MSAPKTNAADLLATLKDAFGEHPDDVLMELRIASDTLDQLEALFAAIKAALASQGRQQTHAYQLSTLGIDVAVDRSNLIDCAHEKYRDRLLSHGIDCGGVR